MKKIILFFAAVFLYAAQISFAKQTPIKSLYSYKLDNGLLLFVAENHAVPLTHIEIAVRCGGYTQNENNVGLFHLYEHMMFKGNSLYKSAAELDRVTSDMGVSDRNGVTNTEYVKYFFTVPSDLTKKGLEFWNAAIRFPNLDEKEFENEKEVVVAEINGKTGETGYKIYRSSMDLQFPEKTYTTDGAGTEEYIRKATVSQMREMMKTYYIPNNSALFVSGDVEPEKVYKMVKKIFGDWKKGADPFENGVVQHTKSPFQKMELRVQPFDRISKEIAVVTVEYRGPDTAFDLEDTYPADILVQLMENPSGYFKQNMVQNPLLGIPDTDYVESGYNTKKTCSVYSFEGTFLSPEQDIAERAIYFAEQIPIVAEKAAQTVSNEEMERIFNRLDDDQIISAQTAAGLASSVEYWWLIADENYYYTYNEKMKQVKNQDLIDFVNRYFVERSPLVTVLINPEVYEVVKNQFESTGFKLLLDSESKSSE